MADIEIVETPSGIEGRMYAFRPRIDGGGLGCALHTLTLGALIVGGFWLFSDQMVGLSRIEEANYVCPVFGFAIVVTGLISKAVKSAQSGWYDITVDQHGFRIGSLRSHGSELLEVSVTPWMAVGTKRPSELGRSLLVATRTWHAEWRLEGATDADVEPLVQAIRQCASSAKPIGTERDVPAELRRGRDAVLERDQ